MLDVSLTSALSPSISTPILTSVLSAAQKVGRKMLAECSGHFGPARKPNGHGTVQSKGRNRASEGPQIERKYQRDTSYVLSNYRLSFRSSKLASVAGFEPAGALSQARNQAQAAGARGHRPEGQSEDRRPRRRVRPRRLRLSRVDMVTSWFAARVVWLETSLQRACEPHKPKVRTILSRYQRRTLDLFNLIRIFASRF